MKLTESEVGSGVFVIKITEHIASATLELHRNFYTYYWRCKFGPAQFIRHADKMSLHDGPESNFTLLNENGQVEQLPYYIAQKKVLPRMAKRDFEQSCVLVRIDGTARSWAWQFSPGDDSAAKYNSDVHHHGLVAYTGCASTANHLRNFNSANEYLANSAIEADRLRGHLDLFARYINRWEKRNG